MKRFLKSAKVDHFSLILKIQFAVAIENPFMYLSPAFGNLFMTTIEHLFKSFSTNGIELGNSSSFRRSLITFKIKLRKYERLHKKKIYELFSNK
jgi:hypothetical protein